MIVQRWTPAARVTAALAALALVAAVAAPLVAAGSVDRLTTLCVYVILAAMWNALAGYGGLVSVGQQAFFGLGGYAAVRLADAGVPVFVSLAAAGLLVGAAAWPLSWLMLRLRAGEFAIGMWVVAELAHLLVNLDGLVQGETGTSLIAIEAVPEAARHADVYWLALALTVGLLGALYGLLHGRHGVAIQAIRDSEEAAGSVGVRVMQTKRVLFVLAAGGAAAAGALWLATAITYQPKTYFSVQWTAYMIFMALVGGLGTLEGPLIGAAIFFAIETWFGASGVWYLVGLGALAMGFALFLPRGLWGTVERRSALRLLPLGYRLTTVTKRRA